MTDPEPTPDPLVRLCERCGRQVMPTGIFWQPIEGLCDCIFWR